MGKPLKLVVARRVLFADHTNSSPLGSGGNFWKLCELVSADTG
jgi:hypothetical protein